MLNKKYSILIILIILHLSPVAAEVLAQSKGNGTDSLLEKLNTPDLKTKLQAYIDLIKYYNKIKPEKSISYSQEALKLARDSNFKQEEGMQERHFVFQKDDKILDILVNGIEEANVQTIISSIKF